METLHEHVQSQCEAKPGEGASAHFTEAQRIVAVAAHEGGQVEGGREAGIDTLGILQQVLEPLVRVICGAKACKLPHGPEARAVHRLVHATGKWIDPGIANPFVCLLRIGRRGVGDRYCVAC